MIDFGKLREASKKGSLWKMSNHKLLQKLEIARRNIKKWQARENDIELERCRRLLGREVEE